MVFIDIFPWLRAKVFRCLLSQLLFALYALSKWLFVFYCTISRSGSTSFFFLSNCFVIFYFPWEIVGFADGKGASKIIINFCTQIFGLINCKWNTQKNRPTRAEVAGGRNEMKRNESFQRLVCLLFIVVEILRLVVYLGSYFSIHLLISVLYWWRIYCIYSSVCGCVCETERVLRGLMQNRFEWKWVNRSTTDMKCVGRIFETKFWFR